MMKWNSILFLYSSVVNVCDVSPFAVSNTCEGALTGNVILIVTAALWCVFGALIAKKYFVTQNDDEKSSPWQAALAIVRAPSLVIFSAIFSINSAALCGSEYLHETQYKWAGALLWAWCVAVVVSLPLIAFLFGTRRYKVTRHPSCLAKVFIPNGYFDIEVGEDHYASVYRCPPMMFSSVVGPYRFSSAIFKLTGVLSSVAVWPVVLLPAGSDHCIGMYWFSAALHFMFALLIVAVRPRRVLLFDLCQAASLLLNGILIALVARQFLDGSYKATSLGDYGTVFQSIEYVVVALAMIRAAAGLALPVYNYRKGSQWALAMDLIDGLLSANMHRADTAWEYAGCLLNGKLAHKVEIPDFFSDMNLAQSFTSRSSNCKTLPPEPIEMVDSVKYDSEFHAAFIPVVDVPDKESDVKRKKEPTGPKSPSPTGPIQQEKGNTSDYSETSSSTDSEDENYL